MIIIDPSVSNYADTSSCADLIKEWKEFCHNRSVRLKSVIIDYDRIRFVGRWGCESRKRPFVVKSANTLEILTSSKTLAGAIRLAAELSETRERVFADR